MVAPSFVNASAPQVDFDNSINLNMPASLVVGNLLVALFRPSLGPVSAPAGWTMKRAAADALIQVAYRRVDGSEPATYTFTCAALNIFSDARCVQLTGVVATGDPFDTATAQNFTSAAASTNLSLTTVTNDCLLLFGDAHNNASATTSVAPSGMTTRGGDPTTFHLFDQAQAVAGGTGNKSHTTTVSVNHYAVLMAIKPVASQTLAVTGFAPAVAFGTTTLRRTVATTGFAPAVVFGTPTVILDRQLPVTGFAPSVAFGTPAIVQEVNPTGFTPTVDFGSPTVILDQFVTPAGFAPSVDFGAPSIGQFVGVDGFTPVVLFGTAVPILDNVLAVSGFSVPVSFGSVTLQAQTVVTGTVFNHETGDPVGPGVVVKLFDDNDVLVDTTTTDGVSVFTFYRPFGDTDTYWTLATYELLGVQYHGVSDRGCAAV